MPAATLVEAVQRSQRARARLSPAELSVLDVVADLAPAAPARQALERRLARALRSTLARSKDLV
jgi:hypothetical protein